MIERNDDNDDLSYGALMMLCEGHGTSKIYERIQAVLAAKDQQVAAWQMAYEGLQRQLAEKDSRIQELEALVTVLSGQLPREERIDILAKAIQQNTIVQQQLVAKDQELARVKAERDEYRALNEHHKDEFLGANLKLVRLTQARDTLLGEAVWAMEQLASQAAGWQGELAIEHQRRTATFLARPDVQQALTERQEKNP